MNRDAVQNERGPRTSTIRKHLATLQAKNKISFSQQPSLPSSSSGFMQSPFGFRYTGMPQMINPMFNPMGQFHQQSRENPEVTEVMKTGEISEVNISSSSSESGIENVSSEKSDEIEVVKPSSSMEQTEETQERDSSKTRPDLHQNQLEIGSREVQPHIPRNNFRVLIAEICGKNLFNCIRWFKHAPMFTSFPSSTKV
jgi:hypothetical protein